MLGYLIGSVPLHSHFEFTLEVVIYRVILQYMKGMCMFEGFCILNFHILKHYVAAICKICQMSLASTRAKSPIAKAGFGSPVHSYIKQQLKTSFFIQNT